MEAVEWTARPDLRNPVAVVAFEGWGDAAEASSEAATFLLEHSPRAEPFAVILPEEFTNFQLQRPTVAIDELGTRHVHWPATTCYALELPDHPIDMVVVLGDEPHLRWSAFSGHLVDILRAIGVQRVITMGAFLGQVPHTRPVPIIGVSNQPELVERYGLLSSNYEGPTGIVGVLNEAFGRAGFESLSLWAAVPHYLAANENPKATRALLAKLTQITGVLLDASELDAEVADFEERVTAAVRSSSDLVRYVEALEKSQADEQPTLAAPEAAQQLVEEIERFLREE